MPYNILYIYNLNPNTMNKIRLTLLAVVAITALVSCTKETKCTLESLAYSNDISSTYEYDSQNRISRINLYDAMMGSTLAAYYTIHRNEDGKIESIDYRTGAGIAIYYYVVTYNVNNYLGVVHLFENSQPDFIADELHSSIYYYYGNDEKVDSTVMLFSGLKRSTALTWTDDHITGLSHRFNNVLQYSRTFVYDNYNGAFSDIAEVEQIIGFDIGEPSVRSFSKNNVIQMSHYDDLGGLIGTYDYPHTANADGYIELYNGAASLNYHCE
jgi:hypothetical protein